MVPSRPCSYPVVLGRPTLCCRNGQGCSREGSAGLVNPPLEGSPYCPAASGHISPCFEGEPVLQQADSEVDLFTLKTKFQVPCRCFILPAAAGDGCRVPQRLSASQAQDGLDAQPSSPGPPPLALVASDFFFFQSLS